MDPLEAAGLYREAANLGHGIAQFNLGLINRYAIGVRSDDVEAAYWFRKSAEQGNADARYLLGNM